MDVKSVIFVPFIYVFIFLAFYACFFVGLVYIFSMGTIIPSESKSDFLPSVTIEGDLRFQLAIYVFMGLWWNAFLGA